ncbi:hypothetical protein B0H13DRAFT_1883792 [Mycena leptocephala]|nr:hypothetical protein B0H13DRAFT_1883792 [Mycena leptocephala]
MDDIEWITQRKYTYGTILQYWQIDSSRTSVYSSHPNNISSHTSSHSCATLPMPQSVGTKSEDQQTISAERDRESPIADAASGSNGHGNGLPVALRLSPGVTVTMSNTSVTVLGLLLPYNLVQDGQAAQNYGIAKHTLWHRDHRRKNRQKAHEDEQTLDAVEEVELVDWLRELDEWGLHLRRSLVISRVKTIVAERAVFISTDHIGTNKNLIGRVKALSTLRQMTETPTQAVKLAKDTTYELERARAEKGNKKADHRRPPGQGRIFKQAVLNQLREARDERDKQAANRGRGRGQGACGGRGGRGSGARRVTFGDIQNAPDSDEDQEDTPDDDSGNELPEEIIDTLDGHPPVFADEGMDEGSSTQEDDENSPSGDRKRKAAGRPKRRVDMSYNGDIIELVSDTGWTRKLSAWVRNGGRDIEIIINALIVEVTSETEEILDSQKLQGSGSAPNSGKTSKVKGRFW